MVAISILLPKYRLAVTKVALTLVWAQGPLEYRSAVNRQLLRGRFCLALAPGCQAEARRLALPRKDNRVGVLSAVARRHHCRFIHLHICQYSHTHRNATLDIPAQPANDASASQLKTAPPPRPGALTKISKCRDRRRRTGQLESVAISRCRPNPGPSPHRAIQKAAQGRF